MLSQHLDPYVARSGFFVAEKDGAATVGVVQPRVKRVLMKYAELKDLEGYHVVRFLEKSLQMYEETRRMPDVQGVGILGWLQAKETESVIITNSQEGPYPVLVDVAFSRKSVRKWSGPVISKMLTYGTKRLINKITRSWDK